MHPARPIWDPFATALGSSYGKSPPESPRFQSAHTGLVPVLQNYYLFITGSEISSKAAVPGRSAVPPKGQGGGRGPATGQGLALLDEIAIFRHVIRRAAHFHMSRFRAMAQYQNNKAGKAGRRTGRHAQYERMSVCMLQTGRFTPLPVTPVNIPGTTPD